MWGPYLVQCQEHKLEEEIDEAGEEGRAQAL